MATEAEIGRLSADLTTKIPDYAILQIERGSTKLSCDIADVLALIENRHDADKVLINFAKETKLRKYPKAQEYLAHFLNGRGDSKHILIENLLSDSGVRNIIVKHFRHASDPKSRKSVVTLGQGCYENKEWKYALGTYFIYYIDVGMHANHFGQKTRHVLAWGEDTYHWDPDDEKRFTQCVHQAADRLQRLQFSNVQAAKEFQILTSHAVIDTTTGVQSDVRLMSLPEPMIRVEKSKVLKQRSLPMCRGVD